MRTIFNLSKCLLVAFFCMAFLAVSKAQQVSPIVYQNGFSIQESVSVSNIRSEEPFKYIVNFTLPDGAPFLDLISVTFSSDLVIDGISPASVNYSGNTGSLVPMPSGGGVQLVFSSFPISGPIAGSFEVNVHLPADKICEGMVLTSTAQIDGSHHTIALATTDVVTTTHMTNPWVVQKFTPGLTYLSGSCPYGTLSETVNYTVRIVKTHPTKVGAETLTSLNILDILPLMGGTINASSYTHSANLAGTSIVGTNIVFPPGFILDPNDNVPYDAHFEITYPPMANGDCATNLARLTGTNPCGTVETIDGSVTVQKINVIPPITHLYKQVFPNGNLPGCTGTYKITVSNTGGSLGAYTLSDVLPAASDLSGLTLVSIPAGATVTGSISGPISVGGSMLPGETITFINSAGIPSGSPNDVYVFNYTINTSCTSTTISNSATATSGFTGTSNVATIYLLPTAATACLQKTICSYKTTGYSVGEHVRFRLRVQNIGGSQILAPTISDAIDPVNLQYISGSERYYKTDNAAAITTCIQPTDPLPTGVYPWAGVSSTYASGTVTYTLPNIPVAPCTSVRTPVCGSAYYIPAYYVEFEVVILNTAGIGNVKNMAYIQGSNIITVAASTTFLTNAPVNYTIKKEVSKDNGITYQQSTTVMPASSILYRLRALNAGVGIINPVIIDLLPRDKNTTDHFTLFNQPRGSNIDVRYNSFVSSTLGSYTQYADNTPGGDILTTLELGITVGGITPSWISPFTNAANLKTEFAATMGGSPSDYVFRATISPYAVVKDHACNTFALRGSVKYLQDYIVDIRKLAAIESNPACIEIKGDSCTCTPYAFVAPDTVCLGLNAHFEVSDSCAGANTYTWNFGDGTSPVTGTSVNHTYTTAGYYGVTLTWHGPCGEGGREFRLLVRDCRCDVRVSWITTRTGLHVVADGSSTTSSYPIIAYVWDFGDGTAPVNSMIAVHDYATAGYYIVTLTVYTLDTKGSVCICTGKCSAQILVNETEGRDRCTPRGGEDGGGGSVPLKLSNAVTMNATPNPFRDKVSVNFKQEHIETTSKSYSLEFISDAGVTLQKKQLKSLDKSVDFNTSNYTAGIYFVLLKDNNGQMQSVKVIKLD